MTVMITREPHGMGWVPDIRDRRDFRFSAPSSTPASQLPPAVVLWTPEIRDQGNTNSCVGQATASLYEYVAHYLPRDDFHPSALFNYWFARHVPRRGWENEDEGAMPRDAMQSMISNGVVGESDWPFTEDQAIVNRRPPQTLLAQAKSNRVTEGKYVRMLANDSLYHLKYSLAQGLPFLIGIVVYSSFYDTGSDGLVPMPRTSETFEGRHLMWVNGYSDDTQRFRVVNSWGESWGAGGIGWMPYPYVANQGLSDDFWRVEQVS